MVDENLHSACVRAWMDTTTRELPPERLILAFDLAFNALWRRAHWTLGEVTLSAICERVLACTAKQFPGLSQLRMDNAGIRCEGLTGAAPSLLPEQLVAGMRFALVEFLTVLGELTAEILTPALHSELLGVTLDSRSVDDRREKQSLSSVSRVGVRPDS